MTCYFTIMIEFIEQPQVQTEVTKVASNTLTPPLVHQTEVEDDSYKVTHLDIFWTVVSIVLRLTSVIINIVLSVEFYQKNEIPNFIWTTCCIVIPMVITTILSIFMYVEDQSKLNRKSYHSIEFIMLVIVLPFLFRYCRSLSYTILSLLAEKKGDRHGQKRYYKKMIKEESDVALIRIFECFLETAPQKVLQLSIIMREGYTVTWIQLAAIASAVSSLAWSMVVYHKYNRYSQADKEDIPLLGVVGQCCWHFCTAVSRVLCLSLIASIFPMWTLVAVISRAIFICFILIVFDRPHFCSTSLIHSQAFCLILGAVYTFAYIIPKAGRTRYRFGIYYTICMIENTICITFFALYTRSDFMESMMFLPMCIVPLLMYLVGIIFMILYYTKCHPSVVTVSINKNLH